MADLNGHDQEPRWRFRDRLIFTVVFVAFALFWFVVAALLAW